MTTVTGAMPRQAAPHSGGVVAVQRARALLASGLLGAHAAALVTIGISTALLGSRGLFSALFGAALVIVFQVLGQVVQVRFADADPRTVLGATLASFAVRVGLMLGVLYAWFNLARTPDSLAAAPFAAAAGLTVVGWLAVEAYAWHRLRVPHQEPLDAPSDDSEGMK